MKPCKHIGQRWIVLDSVDSTNKYALKYAQEQQAHGSVILAIEQTLGKGQSGASWQSNANENITLSLILQNQHLQSCNPFQLVEWVAVCLRGFLVSHFGIRNTSIKWPNDIYIGEKKVAGILMESQFQSQKLHTVVIGIGMNLNQKDFTGLPHASSLFLETGKEFPVLETAQELLFYMDQKIELWYEKPTLFTALFKDNLLGLNEWRNYKIGNSIKKAMIVDITDHGLLTLQFENKETQDFRNKEAVMVL